jgi:hypothetical protein
MSARSNRETSCADYYSSAKAIYGSDWYASGRRGRAEGVQLDTVQRRPAAARPPGPATRQAPQAWRISTVSARPATAGVASTDPTSRAESCIGGRAIRTGPQTAPVRIAHHLRRPADLTPRARISHQAPTNPGHLCGMCRGSPSTHRYRAVIVENVVDAARWVMWPAWLQAMQLLGCRHEVVYLNSMHAPAIAAPRAPSPGTACTLVLAAEPGDPRSGRPPGRLVRAVWARGGGDPVLEAPRPGSVGCIGSHEDCRHRSRVAQ